ncbi:HWE histidine kinase domain-containing protein [Methylobacterium brachiatum]|uniref:HWE histidine kinase domain-containing protein n=1 Tax=Methylobacterium brachiatum TaxID=269660 RepID=UPI0008EA6C34|nr:HWE histidine kinase domain-containing protein [Methylobacterium brachiatum]SFJ57560.1 PAS domain S-box-containing protein [Methylobacterium brachiatum]
MHDVRDPCRLAAPASFVSDTPPEAGFADLVRMARRACATPMALLGLAAGDRVRFQAGAGFEPGPYAPGSSLDGLLGRIPDGPGLLVIPDLTTDPRTRADPLVVAGPGLRFYAGAALQTESGERLGTLCVLDHAPRPGGLGAEEAEDLAALARLAVRQLDFQRSRAARDRLLTQRAVVAGVLTALLEAGDRRAILDLLVAAALAAVPEAEGGGVAMREGADLVYRSGAGTLAGQVGLHRPLAGSLAGAALTGDTALLSPDLAADPRVTQDPLPVPGMRAALYAPVRLGGAVLGILELRAARADAFTPDDLEVARLIAGTVAAGLAETREVGAAEARLATVMDTVPVGILLAEAPSGRIVMGNRRIREVLGHDTLYAQASTEYGVYVAYHADDRPVAPEEFPLARICAGQAARAELEVRYQHPDGARRWIAIRGEAIKDAAGATVGAVVAVSDIEARKRTEANQTLLNGELSHRLKNTLALVQAIAAQTLRNAPDIDAAREALAARLVALGQAHDVLLAGHLAGQAETASVAAVVTGSLALHQDGRGRFELNGPDLLIGPSAALSLALMLHELGTNAVKYGALSTETGRVAVRWETGCDAAGDDGFTLVWRESGGPPVAPPRRRGFGSRLIERGLAGAVGGRAELDFARDGLVCTLTAPLAGFRAEP